MKTIKYTYKIEKNARKQYGYRIKVFKNGVDTGFSSTAWPNESMARQEWLDFIEDIPSEVEGIEEIIIKTK